MKRFLPPRAFIFHFSITVALVAFTFYLCAQYLLKKYSIILFLPFVLLLFYHFIKTNKNNIQLLYGNDVNLLFDLNSKSIKNLPQNSSIGFSDQSFYWYWLSIKRKNITHQCLTGNENYYIKRSDEPMNNSYQNYLLIANYHDDYQVYKKR